MDSWFSVLFFWEVRPPVKSIPEGDYTRTTTSNTNTGTCSLSQVEWVNRLALKSTKWNISLNALIRNVRDADPDEREKWGKATKEAYTDLVEQQTGQAKALTKDERKALTKKYLESGAIELDCLVIEYCFYDRTLHELVKQKMAEAEDADKSGQKRERPADVPGGGKKQKGPAAAAAAAAAAKEWVAFDGVDKCDLTGLRVKVTYGNGRQEFVCICEADGGAMLKVKGCGSEWAANRIDVKMVEKLLT